MWGFVSRVGKLVIALFMLLPIVLVPGLPTEVVKAETTGFSKKREMRAAWISTAWNLDWPQTKNNQAAQKAEFITLLDNLKAMGMNAVIVQVRPMGDALYPTNYAPWSQFLTGTQGKDPGYDPLQFMIAEAHKRNLEFHAWFNPFRISQSSTNVTELADPNPVKEHPEWKVDYNGGMYYDPGIPAVRTLIKNTILEVVRKYDIDAVHLDDYFYPDIKNEADFHDEETFAKYGKNFTNIGDWRRNNINVFMKDLSKSIKATKSYVKFGVSPNGIWKNIPYGDGKFTTGMESYYRVYADSRKWVKQNTVDYITPQVYWKIGYKAAPYEVMLQWWKKQVQGTNVQLYMGHADYKLGINTGAEDWTSASHEIPNQIALTRSNALSGSMHFRAKVLQDNVLGIQDRLKNDVYKYPALIPAMPHKDNKPPAKPSVSLERKDKGVLLSWNKVSSASYYAIYRFKKGETQDIEDVTKLLGTVHKSQGTSYLDTNANNNEQYVYVVTALDRLHNESQPVFVSTIEPIKMYTDQPGRDAELKGITTVKGWSLAEAGVEKVEIIVDGKLVGTAAYGIERLDVYRIYPQYNNRNSGFEYKLDTRKLTQGTHELQIRTTANGGEQRISTVPIRVARQLPIQTIIDEPVEQEKVSGKQKIRGGALAEDGIEEIQVLVDGVPQGKAKLGISRLDLYRAYPQYNNKKSGYEYSLNTKLLAQGSHTITLQVKTKAGDIQKVDRKIEVTRTLPIRSKLESIKNGMNVMFEQNITGWALSEDGIDRVEIFIDGKYHGKASYGLARSDVYRTYPQYKNSRSGYEYKLDTETLSAGVHTVSVHYVTKSGDIQIKETNINVIQIPFMQARIERPGPSAEVSGITKVSGWSLAGSGVRKVEILVDGQVQGIARYGLKRSDVYKLFPEYKTVNSGYRYSLNTKKLSEGQHVLAIRSIAKNGRESTVQTDINVVRELPLKLNLDTPSNGAQVAATYRVAGWALGESGIRKVEVFVDDVKQGEARIRLSRPDVYKAYPKYKSKKSGYEYILNTNSFSPGSHKLKVIATAKNGDKREVEREIEVVDLPPLVCLDEPRANQAIGQVQIVRGWALAETGVSKVEVLVDGLVKGEAVYGLKRGDVAKVFPLYNNENSGFTYSLNTSALTTGYHTITIQVTGKDGKVTDTSSTILISPLHGKTIVLDPGHGGLDSGAVGGSYKEKDINLSVGLKLRDLLQSHGAKVIMTRDTDMFIELTARAKVSNDMKADAFVSLHVNSAESSAASGIETYYYEQITPELPPAVTLEESSRLATLVQSSLFAATNARDRGAKGGNYAVLRENERPAILVELGFISNVLERAQLVSPSYQQKQAAAILDGLYHYFE